MKPPKKKKDPEPEYLDLLDWDAVIVRPPPRRKGKIKVKLTYIGRAKPRPVPPGEEYD